VACSLALSTDSSPTSPFSPRGPQDAGFGLCRACAIIGGSTPQVPWNKVYAHDNWKGPTLP